jgi:hypothetical protein
MQLILAALPWGGRPHVHVFLYKKSRPYVHGTPIEAVTSLSRMPEATIRAS